MSGNKQTITISAMALSAVTDALATAAAALTRPVDPELRNIVSALGQLKRTELSRFRVVVEEVE